MFKISDLLNKFKTTVDTPAEAGAQENQVATHQLKLTRNWYDERYDNMIVQRNLLFVLLLILLVLAIISVAVTSYVISIKRFDPFVIQIDDTTGMAKIVNPISSEILNGNEALAQYFIKKYIIARETYNPVDFETGARNIIKLFSSNSIYLDYRGYIKNPEVDPLIKYGQKNTTFLIPKSWSKLEDNKYILRFSINETAGSNKIFNKIAVVEFAYTAMELTEQDKDINPVGFQVTGYRVDDDSS